MKFIKRYFPLMICTLCLAVFYLRNINDLRMPSILLDEVGYWSDAAFWNGYDWSSVISSFFHYYSFGYSFILFILMKLFKNVELLHQMAIVVNVAMIISAYFFSNAIIKRIFPAVSRYVREFGCVLPLFYPGIQYHGQVAWAETYLFFLFLFSILVAFKIYETGYARYYFLFAFTLVAIYITHQRSIGVVLAGILFVLLATYKNKGIRKMLLCFAVLILCMSASFLIKHTIQSNLYVNTTKMYDTDATEGEEQEKNIDKNDYSGQIIKIKYFFTWSGFCDFLMSILGKLYYFIIASLFFGGDGLSFLWFRIKNAVIDKSTLCAETLVLSYVLVSYVLTLGIASLFMIYPSRIDTVAYGRYTDWIGIIIITFGLFSIFEGDSIKNLKRFFRYMFFIISYTLIFEQYIVFHNLTRFFASCSQIMTFFNKLGGHNLVPLMTVTMVSGALLVRILSLKKNKVYRCTCLIILCVCFWTYITKPAIDELIRIQYPDAINPIADYVKEDEELPVYYLYDDTTPSRDKYYVGSIQYILKDRIINCITDAALITVDAIVIISSSDEVPYGYTIECETSFYRIIQRSSLE